MVLTLLSISWKNVIGTKQACTWKGSGELVARWRRAGDAVATLWQGVNTETLRQLSDFDGYKREFLQLFGFEVDGVDYAADVNPEVPINNMV